VYFIVGRLFASLAGAATSTQARTSLRLTAWILSALAFTVHIGLERLRLRSSAVTTAIHVAVAVAFGAFGLEGAAALRAPVDPNVPRGPMLLALVAWPLITGVPAFVVAWIAANVLGRAHANKP
jgi:ABC-type transport system involved in cytochrome c biogenesis permease component